MIVDDNANNLRTLKAILEEHGFETRAAINGELALKAITELQPDMVLLDIMMPDMNGYEVCQRLKAEDSTKDIPVLFISALDEVEDKVRAFNVGGVDYISKPFQAEEILARVRVHIALARAHQKLESAYNELEEHTTKLEAVNNELTAFSYSVSHDLRAPLRSIDGFSQILLEDYNDNLDDRGKGYLQRIRDNTQHMGTLIDDLLQLSKLSSGDVYRQDINLSDIAQDLVNKLDSDYPGHQVAVQIAPNMVTRGDPRLMEIALNNLFRNAWKYTSKTKSPKIEFGATKQDGQMVYFIRDNGIGFDMQYYNRLFQPFQRLHHNDEFEGSGIGLATVQRIIKLHGGRIWADAAVGSGATFYFVLG